MDTNGNRPQQNNKVGQVSISGWDNFGPKTNDYIENKPYRAEIVHRYI